MEAVIHVFEEMKKTAIPAERVALAISRALRDRRPRARYVVGADVTLQIWLRWSFSDRRRTRRGVSIFKVSMSMLVLRHARDSRY
jgi:hypothetical protein